MSGDYTKKVSEAQLKCPKALRDMLVNLLKKYPDKKEVLRVYGFVLMGRSSMLTAYEEEGLFDVWLLLLLLLILLT